MEIFAQNIFKKILVPAGVCSKVNNTCTTLAVTKGHMFGSSFKIIEKQIKWKKKKNTKIYYLA
jgi:hypothetical protein